MLVDPVVMVTGWELATLLLIIGAGAALVVVLAAEKFCNRRKIKSIRN